MLFDTHAHYNDEKFNADADEVLGSMRDNGIELIMNACSSVDEIPDILRLCEKYDFIYGAVGVHPHEAQSMTAGDFDILKKTAEHPKIKAIGEIGLDYFYDFSPKDVQKRRFAEQVELAKELKMPVIIHDRDAHGDTMDILRACGVRECGGVFHCYAGSVETAREILDWGMYIAFGGSLTFKKSVRPKEVAKYVPLDRIVLETDSPYLAPEPQRGRRNDSRYMHLVAERVAEIKGISYDEVARATFENGKRLFNITV
ncbi:MAG: TatD family hydrolase [Clostridia bacterium]|nr:TatD family hydrolase [Clostridia bacterium]